MKCFYGGVIGMFVGAALVIARLRHLLDGYDSIPLSMFIFAAGFWAVALSAAMLKGK